ncbi:MAG: 2-hydroxyacyl-CoA dehydratase, partial [Candidatus Tectomicrobia bacterium]|nr:2-hydroxyacyl-CoA dehydratase [Candidatus Tectomicrobia bacterium]
MKAEEILAEFRQIFENRHQRCQGLKDRENKRFIGWVCTYVPEEIIHAAGFVPVRVLGGTGDTPTADAHLYSNLCSFVRNALEEVFRNNYDYLEGMVAMNACDHIRRLYDVWSIYLKDKTPFTMVLSVPGKISENAVAVYTEELGVFKERLEVHFGVKITEEALRRSIALYNTTRSLLQEIYALRKSETPPLTGAEAMEIFLAGMVMPKEEYNEKLRQLLEALKSRSVSHAEDRIRLMVMGSELQDPNFIKVIEDLGGLVVNDDLCNGTRHFWGLVNPEGDPLAALAHRYVHKSPCPRIRPHDERVRRLKETIREYNVHGVIYEVMKFCDMHGAAYPIIKRA